MTNLQNVRLGECTVTYNGTDLGFTNGGAEVTVKNSKSEVAIDEYGSSPVKAYHKGTRIEVKVNLAEVAYTILSKVLNGAVLDGSNDFMKLGKKGGVPLAGALLKLHPKLVTGTTQDVELYKAVVIGESKLPYKLEGETTYQVTFVALIDESKANGNLLARFGIA